MTLRGAYLAREAVGVHCFVRRADRLSASVLLAGMTLKPRVCNESSIEDVLSGRSP